MSELTDRFDAVARRFAPALARSGRAPDAAALVAVSKGHGAPALAELAVYWAGHWAGQGTGHRTGRASVGEPCFGESYMQEGRDKMRQVAALPGAARTAPRWHFVGHVQSRKARDIVGRYDLIHSVDSLKLARALDRAWQERAGRVFLGPGEEAPQPQDVLVQVNVGREEQKGGVLPEDLEALLLDVRRLPGLAVRGLMCLPPLAGDAEAARPYFVMLRELRETMERCCGLALPHLSMGMSDDFEAALEEGATLVRIGTDIFGPRAY